MYNDSIDIIYYNFTTTLSAIINKLSSEVSYKKYNITSNPIYDTDHKIARKSIRDAPNKTAKLEKINMYKAFI